MAGRKSLSLNTLAKQIAEREGLRKQVAIGDIKEVLRVLNDLTGKTFYSWIKKNFDEPTTGA